MTNALALCLLLSAALGLTFAARGTALDPIVVPSCINCAVGQPFFVSGSGWKPAVDVFVNVQEQGAFAPQTVECGHADHQGNISNCGPFVLPEVGTYDVFGATPFVPPNKNRQLSPTVVITGQ